MIIEKTLPPDLSIMLKEHWRCAPQIAKFFNKQYYRNQLKIMTKQSDNSKIVKFTKFDNSFKKQIKKIEATYIEKLDSEKQKIALISPFRKIDETIIEKLPTKITKKGTIHKFQGYENDVIVCYVGNKKLAPFIVNHFLHDKQMVNVAISRAKKVFHLYIGEKALKSLGESNHGNQQEFLKIINFINQEENLQNKMEKVQSQFKICLEDDRNEPFGNNDYSYLAEIDHDLLDVIQKNKLFFTFWVRDIDVNAEIKRIKESENIYDLVVFNDQGKVILVINKNKIIFKIEKLLKGFSFQKSKYKDAKVMFQKAKPIMTHRENYYWKIMQEMLKKESWFLLPNVSYSGILKKPYIQTKKMHSDFVFVKKYFNKKTQKHYFKYLFFLELDDATHLQEKNKKNDIKKDKLCLENKLKMIRLKI